MPSDPRVLQLLEEILDSGSPPEVVCRACPELIPELHARWERLQAIQARLGALFPESGDCPDYRSAKWPQVDDELPNIPGYEVRAILGRGGMGVVFKAWHLRLKRPVALKMLLGCRCVDQRERDCLQREAESVASLRHPNIVQVHDVGEHDGKPYFTMEFVDGGTLAERLTGTPQSACEASRLVATLAEAINEAHQGGIVHRDLKPSNVLLATNGAPKISDFGLARRLEGGTGLTLTGAPVGTPSYMAPEQARGQSGVEGPAADIYALGAILYELLTGRPPFRAETAAETLQQVICQEPAAPSRLNAKVPRDLETICLKCLQKEPEQRYANAAALAVDLVRFQEGRPIHARPLGWGGRLWRWCRRKPAAAALVATMMTLAGLALGGGLWLERQRAEQRADTARQEGRAWQAVEARLEQAAALRNQGRWPEMRAALEGAPSLLGTSAPAELRERLRQARADADMVLDLEEIRLRLSEGRKSRETLSLSPEKLYAEAFRKYGIDLAVLESTEAAARVRNSSIREVLLAFLYDWLYWVSDADRDMLRAVLNRADQNEWRRAFREALAERNTSKLKALARVPEAAAQPPMILSGLGGLLVGGNQREEALALLREAQQRYPGDFWVNYLLGHLCNQEYPQQAIGYFRVAVAIRPSSDQAYAGLGRVLRETGDADGAIAAFRKAISLNPNCAVGKDLARTLAPRGGLEVARDAWEKALERDPPDHDSWHGYAELCMFLGKEEAYRRARKALLERFGDTTNDWIVAERTSLACLLLPDTGDEPRRAVELADRAIAAADKSPEPGNPYVRFVKGLGEYRRGRPEQALPFLHEAAAKLPNRAGPRLVLAMAQFQSGSTKEARKTLAAAVRSYNWDVSQTASQPDQPTVCVSHVLRREAEAMILPNLPRFLQGKYQPQNNDERLTLLGICQFQRLCGAAARLFTDAFAADPHLADDLTTECLRRAQGFEQPAERIETFNAACRYLAARCAALAGCGLGKDGANLSEAERTHWRKQAREWLQADLTAWSKTLNGDSPADRDLAKKMLMHWQVDPDLAGLRDPATLKEFSSAERQECDALWSDVDALLKHSQEPK